MGRRTSRWEKTGGRSQGNSAECDALVGRRPPRRPPGGGAGQTRRPSHAEHAGSARQTRPRHRSGAATQTTKPQRCDATRDMIAQSQRMQEARDATLGPAGRARACEPTRLSRRVGEYGQARAYSISTVWTEPADAYDASREQIQPDASCALPSPEWPLSGLESSPSSWSDRRMRGRARMRQS